MPEDVKKCRVPAPVEPGDACDKPATYVVTFQDGGKVLACQGCALRLKQTAESLGFRDSVRAERLP